MRGQCNVTGIKSSWTSDVVSGMKEKEQLKTHLACEKELGNLSFKWSEKPGVENVPSFRS